MIDRQHGKIIFECDACGEVLETDTSDFTAALTAMRAAQWRAAPFGKDWVHTCNGCADTAERKNRARRAGRIP